MENILLSKKYWDYMSLFVKTLNLWFSMTFPRQCATSSRKSEKHEDFNEYTCPRCGGSGMDPVLDNGLWVNHCRKCIGKGKVDWVTNVMKE